MHLFYPCGSRMLGSPRSRVDDMAGPEAAPIGAEPRSRRAFVRPLVALCLLLGLVLSALSAGPAAAERYAAIVVDANTGDILHAEKADEQRYPASLTKMMTLYLVFERLEQGRLRTDTRILISENAAATAPSKLGLEAGATITVGDAIRALITKSANDISVAIAEHLAGDEAAFAEAMTRKAVELGLRNTVFRNAHGLPDARQTTTARDMALLGMRLYDHFPIQSRLFALRNFTFAGRTHRNHNTMLDNFAGMEGLKTGYTRQAGFNLVASVRRDGRHVIATVMGGDTAAARNARMRVLLNRALPRASTVKTRKPTAPPFRSAPPPAVAERKRREPATPAVAEPRLVEPVRVAKRPYPADTRGRGPAWGSTVRYAAPIPGATSTAALVAPSRPLDPPPALRPAIAETVPAAAPIRVATVRSLDIRTGATTTAAPPPSGLARPPSTLQAQAQRLAEATDASSPYRTWAPAGLGGPVASAAAATVPSGPSQASGRAGGVDLQVGAFAAEGEARDRLEAARQRSAALRQAATITPMVMAGGRRLYRARFTGLDATTAARACSELRRQQIDCLVTRAE
jgi:D-alanyl-D-alanine carboxypeptidase